MATEQISRRTEYSTVVANPDGTYTEAISLGRINYQDNAATGVGTLIVSGPT